MKILVPRNIREEYLARLRSLSVDVDIAQLEIRFEQYNLARLFRRAIHRVSSTNTKLLSKMPVRQIESGGQFLIDGELIDNDCPSVEALLHTPSLHPSSLAHLLPLLTGLRWIHSTFTGVDHLPLKDIFRRGIVLTSSVGVHGGHIAEFAMGLILALAKRLPEHLDLQKRKRWKTVYADELRDKVLGIIGFGNIGRQLARLASAFGMNILATKKSPIVTSAVTVLSPRNLETLLRASDFVVIAAPLTPETSEMFGEKEFRMMKKTAYLVNVARGQIVNEAAFVHALRNKWIAGAAVDHFRRMPIPSSSALYNISNLVITHYSAFACPESDRKVFAFFLRNVDRFTRDRPLLSVVDAELGY